MMRLGRILAVSLVLCLCASQASAAGFRLPEAGAKAMGMGFAFTAQADDPSAIYYNPAGLTQLEGTNVMAGVTYVRENGAKFTGSTPLTGEGTITEEQKTLHFYIPNAYVTRKASPNFSYGIGIFAPFGLGQEYKAGSAFINQVTKIDLQTIVVNPTVAWKCGDVLSIGVGIDYMWGKLLFEKTPVSPAPGNPTLDAKLEGTGDAWGYNAGLLLTPGKSVRIGFSYRSPFELKIRDADFTISDNTASLAFFGLSGAPFKSSAKGTGHIPATAAFGAAYKPTERLTLEADLDWTFWSAFKDFSFSNKEDARLSTSISEGWHDVMALRFGAEYQVAAPLAVRLGYAYDPTPVPGTTMSPMLPDSDRSFYMFGVGYKVGKWTVDGSYAYIDKKDRTVSNIRAEGANTIGSDGKWKGDAHLVALDIGYRF